MTNISRMRGRLLRASAFLGVALLGTLVGCSSNLAPVTGKVSHKGAVVKGGTLIFSPMGVGELTPGKPATAEVQEDGTYTLHTNYPGDGAQPGKHRVLYTPPAQKLTEEQRTNPKYIAPRPPYMGLAPKQGQVEVKTGSNTIDIELVPAAKR